MNDKKNNGKFEKTHDVGRNREERHHGGVRGEPGDGKLIKDHTPVVDTIPPPPPKNKK